MTSKGERVAKVVILSGAGISAESGIKTFRDSGGLWETFRVEEVCSAGCLEKNREQTIRFYDQRRTELKDKLPNNAHKVIADLKTRYPDEIAVITQNVDDLFEQAGCSDVIHLHGFLTSIRCEECDYKEDIGHAYQDKAHQVCPRCQGLLRPDIVFFGEQAPKYARLYEELRACELFVVIGTSGEVLDVTALRKGIKYSILNNLEPSRAIKIRKFTKVLYRPATEAIDEIAEWIEQFMKEGAIKR